MKCPDVEQLMLYVDGELTQSEAIEVRNHIASCKSCQHEVHEFQADLETEALLRKKVNNSFAKHQVSTKIMTSVKAEPKHTQKATGSSVWNNWLVRLLVPAFALAIVLFMIFSGTTTNESPAIYHGKLYKVSVFTNNAQSFVDETHVDANSVFSLEPMELKKLNGDFLVNVVSNGTNYSLVVDGITSIKFDEKDMDLVFDDCQANISVVNGNSVSSSINGKKQNITNTKPIQLKKKAVAPVVEEKKPVIEEKVEVTTPVEEVVETVQETPVISNNLLDTAKNSMLGEEESLTTSGTSDINGIYMLGEGGEDEESHSPFEEKQIGGM